MSFSCFSIVGMVKSFSIVGMVHTDDTELGVDLGLLPKFDGKIYTYVLNYNYVLCSIYVH